MAVYLAAIFVFALYAAAIPVKFAFILQISSGIGFGAGLALFENRFAKRSALRRAGGQKPHLPWQKFEIDAKKLAMFHALRRGTACLLRHVRLEQFQLQGSIGTSDAAKTALICGMANALGESLRPVLRSSSIAVRLQPEFSGGASCAQACGMISLRLGHIMLAAILTIFEYANGRLRQWINTRLKTS